MSLHRYFKRFLKRQTIALILGSFLLLLMGSANAQEVTPSSYALSQSLPFNQPSFFPVKTDINSPLYQPTGNWVGRLILPTSEQLEEAKIPDWAWFEVYHAPEKERDLVGQKVRLTWVDNPNLKRYVELVTTDMELTEAARRSDRNGNVIPTRLDGRRQVGPLQSLAGARSQDDVVVAFENAAIERGDPAIVKVDREPVQVTGRMYGLVKIIGPTNGDRPDAIPPDCPGESPCPSQYFRVRHYNPESGNFDGPEGTVRIPQQPRDRNGRFMSTPRGLEDGFLDDDGWYIYGARDADGMFTVQALQPRSAFRLVPDMIILGSENGRRYIESTNWHDTENRKGTLQSVLVAPDAATPKQALEEWKEGDRALVIHLFGGIGGEAGEGASFGTVTGHFSYGIAEVVSDAITGELQLEIKYQQVYAHNTNGILSGTQSWADYMGNMQRGWLGTRPVSDVIIKLDAFTETYDFDGLTGSPLDELMRQLQVITARYRTGDGSGVSPVTPSTSCVQDSSQGLFIAIAESRRRFNETPEIREWLEAHPDDPQTQKFRVLAALGEDLKNLLTPQGTIRPDWQQNAEQLAGVDNREGFVANQSIIDGILSWRSMLPRRAHDEVSEIFLKHGASLWFVRPNQVGGWDPDILPMAPTVVFGQIPILSIPLNRLGMAVVAMTGWDWLVLFGTSIIYAAIALPLGFSMQFLRWNPGQRPPLKLAGAIALLFIMPALLEEVVFRVFLIPHPLEAASPLSWLFWAAFSLFLFVIYHPLAALTYNRKGYPTFVKLPFLSLATLLGLSCTVAYGLTGCLWVPVLFHWVAVTIWLFLLDGEQKIGCKE